MILPTDIPTRAQLERLFAARDPSSVSIGADEFGSVWRS
jgi:hypothetical protein